MYVSTHCAGVYKNTFDCFKKMLSMDGPMAFAQGLEPALLRSVSVRQAQSRKGFVVVCPALLTFGWVVLETGNLERHLFWRHFRVEETLAAA